MMKNTLIRSLLFLIILGCLSSCCKDDNKTQISVTFERFSGGSQKLHIDNSNNVCWDEGEVVCINNQEVTIFQGENTSLVYIDASSVTPYGGEYYALIPKSAKVGYENGSFSFQIPSIQTYSEVGGSDHRQKVVSPMVAKGSDGLNFKNVGSLIKITLPSSAVNIRWIKVETDATNGSNIVGNGTVSGSQYSSGNVNFSLNSKNVTLRCENYESTNKAYMNRNDHTYYLAVAPFTNQKLKIWYADAVGEHYIQMANNDASIGRNQIAVLNLSNIPEESGSEPKKWHIKNAQNYANGNPFIDLGDVDAMGNHILWSTTNTGVAEQTTRYDYNYALTSIQNTFGVNSNWKLPTIGEFEKLITHPYSWSGNTITFMKSSTSPDQISLRANNKYLSATNITDGSEDCCYWTKTPGTSGQYKILLVDRNGNSTTLSCSDEAASGKTISVRPVLK